jgi:ABC-type amino acid transport substrate-binding protein
LANGVVPGVVLFSIAVGVALVGLPGKGALLDVLATASSTLARVIGLVVKLMPYGVFFIAASTAGTMRVEQMARLEVYLIAYGGLALLLALWVLPGLVGALTPIRARDILVATRDPLLTAAVAGDLFIVLPVLTGACSRLAARHNPDAPQAAAMPEVIVPVSFNFPHSGKLLSVSFILFAAWFSDAAIPLSDYPRLALTAVVTLFGSVMTAMPFLLDVFRVPADTFQLFIASGVLNSRFGTLVAAMHTVAVALLGTCAVSGTLRWRSGPIVRYAATTAVLTLAVVGGTRLLAARVLEDRSTLQDPLAAMTLDVRSDAVMLTAAPPLHERRPEAGDRLQAIDASRTLRVGYLSDALPYAFAGAHGQLVGFDVALMHRLATELGVRLEFVPIDRRRLDQPHGVPDLLRHGYCDVVIGGVAVTPARARVMQLSAPYLDETLGFVVPDGDRRRFESWDTLRAAGSLAIALPTVPYYVEQVRQRLPAARLTTVETVEALFAPREGRADALALPAERGSAWTLRYPQYSVVVPLPDPIKVPLAFALPRGQPELALFVNTWLDLKRRDGTVDALYRYWILGRDREPARPRWSIIRDVLHWID